MKPLARALASWQPTAARPGDPVLALQGRWREVVGPEVAAHSRPVELAGDTLLIHTRSSAWSQQLAFLVEPILEAVAQATGTRAARLRFRVGRLAPAAVRSPARRPTPARSRAAQTAADPLDALARFRRDVEAERRAKSAAGLKDCPKCGAPALPPSEAFCAPCANAQAHERHAAVARLLYEMPFVGYHGIAERIEGLTHAEYETVRRRLLTRWWDTLMRLRRAGGPASPRERGIASSYLLVKTQLPPERLSAALIRNELGERLTDILYGNEETN